jgi:hypothetical protein
MMMINPYRYRVLDFDVLVKSIPNLEYFYYPPLMTGIADGAELSTVADQSGNGKTLTPLTAARYPTYETNEINGLPVIRFANTDNLVGTKVNFDFLHQGNSTMFWLIKPTDNASLRYLFSSSENTATNVGRTIRYVTGLDFNDTLHAGTTAQNVFTFTTTTDAIPVNQWSLIVVRYERNKVGDDAELLINDDAPLSNQGTLAPSVLTSSVNPTFFSLASGGSSFIGDVATWFGYSRALTNAEINTITGGLPFGL